MGGRKPSETQRQKNASEQQASKTWPRRRQGEFVSEPDLVVVTIPILSPIHLRTASFDCAKVFQVARVQRELPLATIFRRLRERSETTWKFVMGLIKKNHSSTVL